MSLSSLVSSPTYAVVAGEYLCLLLVGLAAIYGREVLLVAGIGIVPCSSGIAVDNCCLDFPSALSLEF